MFIAVHQLADFHNFGKRDFAMNLGKFMQNFKSFCPIERTFPRSAFTTEHLLRCLAKKRKKQNTLTKGEKA